jgi:hypothetical protein
VSELLEQVNTVYAGERGQHNAKSQGKDNAKGMPRKSNMQAKIYNGVPMRTVLKTGGQTLLRAEIYCPVAVYLRLLALLVATYLGTVQCHNYSDNGTTKEGEGNTDTQWLMYLFQLEGLGGQTEVRAGVGGDLFLC